jgi:hypothetical protein
VIACFGSWMLVLAVAAGGKMLPTEEELQRQAETAFQKGVAARARPAEARQAFAAAAQAYEALHQRGVRNADLYRNLAFAHHLAGQLPQALLAYHRGLRLAPADKRLRAGLEAARDEIAYPADLPLRPQEPAWPAWLPWPVDPLLLGAALVAYTAAWLLGALGWRRRQVRWVLLSWLMALLALVSGIAWAACCRQRLWEEQHPWVIVAREDVPLRTGNGSSYPPHARLPRLFRGLEGRQLAVRGAWIQVLFPGDFIGWLRREEVLVEGP